jgi:acyl-CoA thioesterase I
MNYLKHLCYILIFIMAVSFPAVNHARAEAPPTIMAFGDSLVAGYGLKPEQSFPARLEVKLKERGFAVKVINAGVSGETTSGAVNRLEWNLNRQKPDYVVLITGGNDMLRSVDPSLTRMNLQKMMEILRAHKIPVLVAGMRAFPNLGPGFAAAYPKMYKDIASAYGAAYYPFYLEGVALNMALSQDDGVHPNAAGVDVIVGKMLPKIEKLLKGEKK